MAHYALLSARVWAADALNPRARQAAAMDRLTNEVALLQEEIRITRSHMMPATNNRVVYLVDDQVEQIHRREDLDIRIGSITGHLGWVETGRRVFNREQVASMSNFFPHKEN